LLLFLWWYTLIVPNKRKQYNCKCKGLGSQKVGSAQIESILDAGGKPRAFASQRSVLQIRNLFVHRRLMYQGSNTELLSYILLSQALKARIRNLYIKRDFSVYKFNQELLKSQFKKACYCQKEIAFLRKLLVRIRVYTGSNFLALVSEKNVCHIYIYTDCPNTLREIWSIGLGFAALFVCWMKILEDRI
jgi:hypothetical protein